MAELILTPEEDKTTWAQIDDATIGKATKWIAFKLGLADSCHPAPSILMVAATTLINLAAESNANKLEQRVTNAMREGVPIGDWVITVKKVKSRGKND